MIIVCCAICVFLIGVVLWSLIAVAKTEIDDDEIF